MVGVYVLVILTTVLVILGTVWIIDYYNGLAEARRRKTMMDIQSRIIPEFYDGMMDCMDSMMEKALEKSMEMTKKITEEWNE